MAENKPPLLRKMSFTSSLDNIAIGSEEREKVHLSCFSKEMGSNVDLVQVCQEQEEDKHEVKLEFKIEENDVEKSEKQRKENDGQLEEDLTERIIEEIVMDGGGGKRANDGGGRRRISRRSHGGKTARHGDGRGGRGWSFEITS